VDRVNLAGKLARVDRHWTPAIVADLNDHQVKVVKIQGAFEWHHHEREDELFLVVKGRFCMEFRDRSVWLETGDLIVVPKGVEHRPVAEAECEIVLIEPATTLNTGNVRSERTVDTLQRL